MRTLLTLSIEVHPYFASGVLDTVAAGTAVVGDTAVVGTVAVDTVVAGNRFAAGIVVVGNRFAAGTVVAVETVLGPDIERHLGSAGPSTEQTVEVQAGSVRPDESLAA